MAAEKLVQAFYNGTIYSFVRSDVYSPSTFGGPPQVELLGVPHGPRPLHLLAYISGWHLNLPRGPFMSSGLPLLYGMSYEGCSLFYRVLPSKVDILAIDPAKSSEDWPYPNYPLLLPHIPLTPLEPRQATYEEFGNSLENNNTPVRPLGDLVIVIPPPATAGMSLWGRDGDAEGVIIIFDCNTQDGTVRAYNQAS
jgi:hypothetical protein